jgi:two-component system LytT family response regulator
VTLRVLVADDELLARRRLARLLGEVADVELAGECADADAVLRRVREGGVDVVLLDIEMPGLSGIDALAALSVERDAPGVIFCTAHPDYAIDAFDGGAIDYLLKPVELARLRKAIERARTRSPSRAGTKAKGGDALERLAISTRQGIVLLDPSTVSHAILDGALVTIVSANGALVTDLSLGQLERRLPADAFVRVHRRALVNLAHVVRLEPLETGGFVAHTSLGHAIEVSRKAARALRRRLGLGRASNDDEVDDGDEG